MATSGLSKLNHVTKLPLRNQSQITKSMGRPCALPRREEDDQPSTVSCVTHHGRGQVEDDEE
eukprot:3022077-Pyramimonas_sp.AAC.2